MSNADRLRLSLIQEGSFGVTPPSVRAQGTLTMDTNPTDADTMTIGLRLFVFVAALTGALDEILIGAAVADTKVNTVNALKADLTTLGVTHGCKTSADDAYPADAFVGDDLIINAKLGGTAGNSVATTETFTAGTNIFDAATLGTTTAGSGVAALDVQRITSESLLQDTSTTQSQEIREDRQITDNLRTDVSGSGDINFEFSYLAQEQMILAGLMASAFSAPVTDVAADTAILADNATNSLQGATGEFANYAIGETVRISGFANAANNGIAKITNISATSNPNDTLTLSHIDLVDEAAGPAISVTQFGSATNGVVQKSFTVEKCFKDLIDIVHVLRGMHVNQFDLAVATGAVITGTIGMIGKNLSTDDNYPVGTSYTAAPTNDIMTGVDGVLAISEGGQQALGAACATNFSMSMQNNLRALSCIGVLGASSIGVGSFVLTGSLTRYFRDNREMDKYLNATRSSLYVAFEDNAGNQYVVDIPSLKYTSGGAPTGGQNSDIVVELDYQALLDPVEGITVRICKLDA